MSRFAHLHQDLYAYGFPRWKHPVLRQCFPGRHIIFLSQKATVPKASWLILWGMAPAPAQAPENVRVIRMEDGFLRSVGLGADLVRPLSWVADTSGIYYNAQSTSDLERILEAHEFDAALITRAARLRERLVETGITKYNVGATRWQRPDVPGPVILVPGQVESDASIAYGAPIVTTNLELLRRVREQNPGAYIVYKPHPDVVARLRLEGEGEKEAHRWCDAVVTDASMGELLNQVDAVHVLTSLAGFEALLRGKDVTCWGQPFYSGWGLTRDPLPCERRTRMLTLDELVAGALIEYPLYLSRDGRRLITAEEALECLLQWRQQAGNRPQWWLGIYRVFLRYFAGVR